MSTCRKLLSSSTFLQHCRERNTDSSSESTHSRHVTLEGKSLSKIKNHKRDPTSIRESRRCMQTNKMESKNDTCPLLAILEAVVELASLAGRIGDVRQRMLHPQDVVQPVEHGILRLHQVIVCPLKVADVLIINTLVVDVKEDLKTKIDT